jgi:hypothetical protein
MWSIAAGAKDAAGRDRRRESPCRALSVTGIEWYRMLTLLRILACPTCSATGTSGVVINAIPSAYHAVYSRWRVASEAFWAEAA